jgi:hypothetical protein
MSSRLGFASNNKEGNGAVTRDSWRRGMTEWGQSNWSPLGGVSKARVSSVTGLGEW